ncbi:putative heterokaryon incompatibility protein [Periconia macrospinosa]|uniref:Putative heterokaryon incompatibility protein n=1 Tax=Periconia macrospinosa TaxID=97972 RepID=A0A2V1D9B0_9PLEO|nr:putative heterokaryon incompatibility protein [Periconia macrospinosa]
MLTPQWDEEFFTDHEKKHQTTIVLDRICDRSKNFAEVLKNEIEAIDPALLLFLRRITRLRLTVFDFPSVHEPVISKLFYRTKSIESTVGSGLVTLRTLNTGKIENVFFRHPFSIGFEGTESRRPDIKATKIILAFPVTNQPMTMCKPLIRGPRFTYAYLPLGNFGFKFVIQADFLTTSNRQSVDEDSDWNKNIANGIPRAFETAVTHLNDMDGNTMSELARTWPLYLDHHTDGLSPYWSSIKIGIKQHLRTKSVVKNQKGSFSQPQNLMFLDWARDRNDAPIFGSSQEYVSFDYPESVREALLSLGVTTPDWKWVSRKLLELHRQGLLHVESRTKACGLDTRGQKHALRSIPLIPLPNGTWRSSPSKDEPIYFPASLGTTIPPGLPLVLVEEEASACPERKKLFQILGVKNCDVPEVTSRIIDYHVKFSSATNENIIAQGIYLYKMRQHLQSGDMRKVYFACSNSEYLQRGSSIYTDTSLKGQLKDLFSGYNEAFFLDERYFSGCGASGRRSIADWLAELAGVALVPRLVGPFNQLHSDFAWLLDNNRDQVLTVLYENWYLYNVEKSKQLYLEIQSRAFSSVEIEKVRSAFSKLGIPFTDGTFRALEDCVWHGPRSYAHKPALYPIYRHELQRLFQDILNIPNMASEDSREYLLELGRNRSSTMADVIEIYVHIKAHCADTFTIGNRVPYIAVPSEANSALEWKTRAECVWDDVEFSQNGLKMESKCAIRHIIEQNAPAARGFFTQLLKLPDAGVDELLDDLALMQEQNRDEPSRVYMLYERIESYRRRYPKKIKCVSCWRTLFNRPLVFLRGINEQYGRWLPLGHCIWTRSVLKSKYALMPSLNQYRALFRDTLGVQNVDMGMLVDGLLDATSTGFPLKRGERHQYIKEIVQDMARLRGAGTALQRLDGKKCWPCRTPSGSGKLCAIGNFYVNDRQDLFDIFSNTHNFLDFDFDNSRNVENLLRNRGCCSFLSEEVTVQVDTESKELGYDQEFMLDLKGRKNALLKYFEFAGCSSPYKLGPLLESMQVWLSANIKTHYKLANTTVTRSEGGSTVKVRDEQLEVYVSTNRHVRNVALITDFPGQLVAALELKSADISDIQTLLQVPLDSLPALLIKRGITADNAFDDHPEIVVVGSSANISSHTSDTTLQPDVEAISDGGLHEPRLTTPELLEQDRSSAHIEESPRDGPVTPRPTVAERLQAFFQDAGRDPISRESRHSTNSGGIFNMGTMRETLDHASVTPQTNNTLRSKSGPIPNRNEDELARDFEVGFLGEQFLTSIKVYNLLHDILRLPGFTAEENWTSTLRSRAGFSAFAHREVSDFTYKDTEGALTRHFLQMQHPYRTPEWLSTICNDGNEPLYRLEAEKLQVASEKPSEVYAVLRVSGLNALEDGAQDRPKWRVYLDPHTRGKDGVLRFTEPTYAVMADV